MSTQSEKPSSPPPPAGTLFVVATPIGNLGDLSPRAAQVLRSVRAVVAEDTRRTRQLYAHLAASAPVLISLPAFDERSRIGPILAKLAAGEEIALCTDAGTPGISDPGQALVDAAWGMGARVVPLPGPCAAISALAASGLRSDRFLVIGFLPRKGSARVEAFAWLSQLQITFVLYEAGNRVEATLRDLLEAVGNRRAALARELTKIHEQIVRGTLSELTAQFTDSVRGEVTLVVEGGPVVLRAPADSEIDAELRNRVEAGEHPTEIARSVAREHRLKRSEVYDRLERIKRG
jgi:16S rRNA (cytidine1402-2'-O)-methyltransferase